MKNKYLLPFTMTALMAALSGCGGESANIIPEKDTMTYVNGTCKANDKGCTEFILDYPVDGLNFTCSSDANNTFITLMDFANSVVTGTCRTGDKAKFFMMGSDDRKISLGEVDLNKISSSDTIGTVPRLTLLDLAAGITGQDAKMLQQSDPTVKVALELVKIIQALALKEQRIEVPTDIQALYITDAVRQNLEKISTSVTAEDIVSKRYVELIRPWLDVSQITDQDAFITLNKLVNIANSAVYQPEFAVFPTNLIDQIASNAGSEGMVGCNKPVCDLNDISIKRALGHFMLITDRQGYTLGSGIQWKGSVTKATSAVIGANLELITSTRPVRITAESQDHWINPLTKRIDQPFTFKVSEQNSQDLLITQGKLLNNSIMAGQEKFYKKITRKTTITEADKNDLGHWQQEVAGELFQGPMDLYKIYHITYLDKKVFKSINNSRVGENYIFPLYADLTFKFNDTSINNIKLGIVVDANGDIRTNIRPNATASDMSTALCNSDSISPELIDNYGVQQYRLGTTARVFTNDNSISVRMILANDTFNNINGALVGMNVKLQLAENGEILSVGGARIQLGGLLNGNRSIRFTDSAGEAVQWANTLASFQNTFNNANQKKTENDPTKKEVTQADLNLAKLAGGKIEMTLPDCYQVKTK